MFASLSRKTKERLAMKQVQHKCFHKLKYHYMTQKLFKVYNEHCKDINIRFLRKNGNGEKFLDTYGQNVIVLNSIEATLDLIVKMSIVRHLDSDEVEAQMGLIPRVKGFDILRAYTLICYSETMPSEHQGHFFLGKDLANSISALLFSFDQILSKMRAAKVMDIHLIPCQHTWNFWAKVKDFYCDFQVFLKHDRCLIMHCHLEKYRFLRNEAYFHQKLMLAHRDQVEVGQALENEYEMAMDLLGKSIVDFTNLQQKFWSFEGTCLRFLDNFARNNSDMSQFEWLRPICMQGLSFHSMTMLKMHFFCHDGCDGVEQADVPFSSYYEINVFNVDWNLDDMMFFQFLDSDFRMGRGFVKNPFFYFTSSSFGGFDPHYVKFDFENDEASVQMVKKCLLMETNRLCMYLRKLECIFQLCLANFRDEVPSSAVDLMEQALTAFKEKFSKFALSSVLLSRQGTLDEFFSSFLADVKYLVNGLLSHLQNLMKLMNPLYEIDDIATSFYFDTFELRYQTLCLVSRQDSLQRCKQFMAMVPSFYDFFNQHVVCLLNSAMEVSLEFAKRVQREVLEDDEDKIVEYFQADFESYVEKYGAKQVLKHAILYTDTIKNDDYFSEWQYAIVAGQDPHDHQCAVVYHHFFWATMVLNPPHVNVWPETLWRFLACIATIRRELDFLVKVLLCSNLVEAFASTLASSSGVQLDLDPLRKTFSEMELKENQEETNLGIYRAIDVFLGKDLWKCFKSMLFKDHTKSHRDVVKQLTLIAFSYRGIPMVYAPAFFLESRLALLRKKFLHVRNLDWKLHSKYYVDEIFASMT